MIDDYGLERREHECDCVTAAWKVIERCGGSVDRARYCPHSALAGEGLGLIVNGYYPVANRGGQFYGGYDDYETEEEIAATRVSKRVRRSVNCYNGETGEEYCEYY